MRRRWRSCCRARLLVRHLLHDRKKRSEQLRHWSLIAVFLIAGGLATLLSFRIFQPYAFDGLWLNLQWLSNIAEQRAQAAGSDLPWNLQWARRSHLYSFTNLTMWGLGLPLGILAWAGFLLMGWRIIKGEWKHLLLWGWTAFYFIWQSLQFNPTMRYQLPIYPLLCMMAAWFLFELPKLKKTTDDGPQTVVSRPLSVVSALVGVTVLILTAVWAFAFQSIYLRPEPRIAASRWIFQTVPGPVNVRIETADNGIYNQPVPMPADMLIPPGAPYTLPFSPKYSGDVFEVVLGHARDPQTSPSTLVLAMYSASAPEVPLAIASESGGFQVNR